MLVSMGSKMVKKPILIAEVFAGNAMITRIVSSTMIAGVIIAHRIKHVIIPRVLMDGRMERRPMWIVGEVAGLVVI